MSAPSPGSRRCCATCSIPAFPGSGTRENWPGDRASPWTSSLARPWWRPASSGISPRIQALSELCDIVEHLHSRNIVHNDLKLENVLWRTTGGVVLVDFGNVRRLGPVREITSMFLREPPRAFNTATYVAPELLTGGKATCASDVYALGVCAFLVLTGQPPFTDKTQSAKLRAHATATPPAIRGRIPTLPAAQAQVMDACLAKFASARPTARDLASAVRSLVRKIAPSLAAG